jgi:hypothetical protein
MIRRLVLVAGALLVASGCELIAPLRPLPVESRDPSGGRAGEGSARAGGAGGKPSSGGTGALSAGTDDPGGAGGEPASSGAGGIGGRTGGTSGTGAGGTGTGGTGEGGTGMPPHVAGGASPTHGGLGGGAGEGGEPQGGSGGTPDACTPSIVSDAADRVDEAVSLPRQGTWHYLGTWCLGPPAALNVGPDLLRVAVRDWEQASFSQTELQVDRGSFLMPSWTRVENGVFTDGPVLVDSSSRYLVGSGLDRRPWGARWDEGPLAYFDLLGPQLEAPPVIVEISPGTMLTVGRGLDHHIRYQVHVPDTGGWQPDWYVLERSSRSEPAAVPDGDGGAHVVLRDADGSFTYAHWRADAKERWGVEGWTTLSGACFSSAPTLIKRSNETVDVFGRGNDGSLYWQVMQNGVWSGWVRISGPFASNPIAVADSADSFVVFAEDSNGWVWMRRYHGGWTAWTNTGAQAADAAVDVEFPGSALALGENDVALFLCAYGNPLYQALTP